MPRLARDVVVRDVLMCAAPGDMLVRVTVVRVTVVHVTVASIPVVRATRGRILVRARRGNILARVTPGDILARVARSNVIAVVAGRRLTLGCWVLRVARVSFVHGRLLGCPYWRDSPPGG
jgi:hypothetical protein